MLARWASQQPGMRGGGSVAPYLRFTGPSSVDEYTSPGTLIGIFDIANYTGPPNHAFTLIDDGLGDYFVVDDQGDGTAELLISSNPPVYAENTVVEIIVNADNGAGSSITRRFVFNINDVEEADGSIVAILIAMGVI